MINAGIFVTTIPFAGFGGLIAKLFIQNTEKSWRWNYYINMITCGLSVILYVFCYYPPGREVKHKGQSRLEGLKEFDYIGFVLYVGGLVLVLLGLCKFIWNMFSQAKNWPLVIAAWGGSSYAWSSSHVIAVLLVGFVSLIAFVAYGMYSSCRMIPNSPSANSPSRDRCSPRATAPTLIYAQESRLHRDCLLCPSWQYGFLLYEVCRLILARLKNVNFLQPLIVCCGRKSLPTCLQLTRSRLVGLRWVPYFWYEKRHLSKFFLVLYGSGGHCGRNCSGCSHEASWLLQIPAHCVDNLDHYFLGSPCCCQSG